MQIRLDSVFALLLSGLVTLTGVNGYYKRHGGSSVWKCVYSPEDGASVWVTKTGPHTYACAGPTHGLCYWLSPNCTQLITSTELIGKECCCNGPIETGWCRVAKDHFNPTSSTTPLTTTTTPMSYTQTNAQTSAQTSSKSVTKNASESLLPNTDTLTGTDTPIVADTLDMTPSQTLDTDTQITEVTETMTASIY